MEWWYFTGNLADESGRRFGYELTFFRFARQGNTSGDATTGRAFDMYFADTAISDLTNKKFLRDRLASPELLGMAHAATETIDVALSGWSCKRDEAGVLHLRAKANGFALDLSAPESEKVLQGPGGLSRKGPEPGNASYYYSMPRLETKGVLTVGTNAYSVTGLSWFDHEFFSRWLGQGQTGWDWIALQLVDGRSLMLYRVRNRDGTDTRFGSLDSKGKTKYLSSEDFSMIPSQAEKAPSGGVYPQHWELKIAGLPMISVQSGFPEQEQWDPKTGDMTYFEGAVKAVAEGKVFGRGYLEMTGYPPAQ